MKVLVTATNYSKYCQKGKQLLLDAGCELIENPHGRPYTQDELEAIIGEVDGVIVGVDSWNTKVFEKASKLKVMARFGVGVDNIDLNEAKKRGIVVCNCPGVNTTAVSEQALALLLSLTRGIPQLNSAIRRGEWVRPMSYEIKSRTIGFLGFGAIAQDMARKLQGFQPTMIAYDKLPNQKAAKELGVHMVTLKEVLQRSDIISIHLPATLETAHLINQDTIIEMKHGVILINTARGSIVDENAIVEALASGKIAGMGTDVFESEPIMASHPLFKFTNYIATPHTAAETYENCEATSVITAKAILDVFEGLKPKHRLV